MKELGEPRCSQAAGVRDEQKQGGGEQSGVRHRGLWALGLLGGTELGAESSTLPRYPD